MTRNDRPDRGHPEELLPWLANGTLAGGERARVEAHVAGCPRCRAELDMLRALRHGVQGAWHDETPGGLGWARLRASLRRERRTRRRRWLAAAAGVLLALQTGLIAALLAARGPGEAVYRPLGEERGPALAVRFRPGAREAEIRAALRRAGAEIVGGPGALGIYRVAPRRGDDGVEALRRRLAAEAVVAEVRGP